MTATLETTGKVSSCCHATLEKVTRHIIVAGWVDDPTVPYLRCAACGEKCAATFLPCPLNICDGSGEVPHYEHDEHGSYRAGVDECPHVTGEFDGEDDDDDL